MTVDQQRLAEGRVRGVECALQGGVVGMPVITDAPLGLSEGQLAAVDRATVCDDPRHDAQSRRHARVVARPAHALDKRGIEFVRGAIEVDEWSQSSVPSIFAVGDVTDRVNLTPVAIREGHAFADTIFGARPRKVRHDLVASAVYLRPGELGSIGLTEEEARGRGPVDVYSAVFRPMRSMFAGSNARTLMKLLVEPETDRVLGCHIFGPEAGEMIQIAAIPITMGCTKADFDATMAVHPTAAEELVTMREPVRTA